MLHCSGSHMPGPTAEWAAADWLAGWLLHLPSAAVKLQPTTAPSDIFISSLLSSAVLSQAEGAAEHQAEGGREGGVLCWRLCLPAKEKVAERGTDPTEEAAEVGGGSALHNLGTRRLPRSFQVHTTNQQNQGKYTKYKQQPKIDQQ